MEPLAPGTEDEVQVTFPIYSKKANEEERLLSVKGFLPNGEYANIFELSYQNGSEHWYCNMCECPVMGRVYHHEIGKRHTLNMQNSAKRQGQAVVQADAPTVQVAPGEPVPPGFEREIERPTLIQERLDSYTVSPLVGLEYVLEIQEYDRDKEPSYLCMLCDKRGDPRTVIAHLVSYNHITQYLQRHFIKVYRALSPYITKQYKRNWQNTVNKIAEAIELQYGRLKPHPAEKEGFDERKAQYWQMIFSGPHFNDKNGVTFEELVVREEITKLVEDPPPNIQKPSEEVAKRTYRKTGTVPGAHEPPPKKKSPSPPVVAKPTKKPKPAAPAFNREIRRSLSSVSSISSSDLSDYEPPEKKKTFRNSSPPKSTGRSHSPIRRSKYQKPPSPRNAYRDKPGMLPWQRPDYIKSRNEVVPERSKPKTDKYDEYRKLSSAIENDMDKTLKQHEKNPEKHPQYNEEWKKFWNKRYKELQAEGKDAANHDFKPEWIIFWNKRMIEIHHSEVRTKKDALRKRLGLPEEPAPICFRITGKKKPGSRDSPKSNKPAPMASEPDQDHEVIIIEDKDDDTKSSKRSHSPWESETVRPKSRISRERSREREIDYGRKSREHSYDRRSHDRDYKRDYRSPGRRYRREKARDSEYRSHVSESSWDPDTFRDPYRKDMPDCYKPPHIMRDVTRQPVFNIVDALKLEPEEDPNEDINVVGVLRLLTALEEKLGSLGPKIIDMLSQALALEKNEANSSESLLDSDVNCVLFETVKEKLKGQLLAGLVDYMQEKAFKNAIKKIASLMHFANELKKRKQRDKPKVDPVKVPGIGTVDKSAIAKQIATALVCQGKTDVTQDELEQLINAVVGMAEASKSSGKPITTATFLERLNLVQKDMPKQGKETPPVLASLASSCDASSSMEGLSDSDLQTLLQNFKDLSTDEQHGLITYLKKLESKEPERVERLRKFVNLGSEPDSSSVEKSGPQAREPVGKKRPSSPFSSRLGSGNPMVEENDFSAPEDEKEDKRESKKEQARIKIDSDDEDYSFEDVFKAAKKTVTANELEKERKLVEDTIKREPKNKVDLSDAKALIANIMDNINKRESPNLLSLGTKTEKAEAQQPTVSAASIVTALGLGTLPVNVSNLANIVGNIQSMEQSKNALNAGPIINPSDLQKPQFSQSPQLQQVLQNPQLSRPHQNLTHIPQSSQNLRPNENYGTPGSGVPQNMGSPDDHYYQGQNPNFQGNLHMGPNQAYPMLNARPDMTRNHPAYPSQNVQYPMKESYGNYHPNVGYPNQDPGYEGQSTAYPNQAAYSRGPMGNPNVGYDHQDRYNPGFDSRGVPYNRQGGNYGGNHW